MKVFTSKICLLHAPESEFLSGTVTEYYESPARLGAIATYLNKPNHGAPFDISDEIQDFGMSPIEKVHKPNYLEYLITAYQEWIADGGHKNGVVPSTIPHRGLAKFGKVKVKTATAKSGEFCFDLSAVIMKDTWRAAYESAQVTLTAAAHLLHLVQTSLVSHESPPGVYALCRPPGHHAQSDLCGGYCYLNNVGIAAQWLIDQGPQTNGRVPRVAILDIDYHHGNGSQEMFYSTSNPLYTSLHAGDDYPYFTGAVEEKGEGEGLGFNINIPLPQATTNDEYAEKLNVLIQEHVVPYDPDYIVISLGVDTFVGDPIAGFLLTTDVYPRLGDMIRKIGKPTLIVQEGGYNMESIGVNVGGVLEGFLGRHHLH